MNDLDVDAELNKFPELDAAATRFDMHMGRLEMLKLHIRRNNFHIHPQVAEKILDLIEGTYPATDKFTLSLMKKPSRVGAKAGLGASLLISAES